MTTVLEFVGVLLLGLFLGFCFGLWLMKAFFKWLLDQIWPL